MRSHTPAASTASSTWPSRASESATLAAAISEYGPPSWNAASVSVKFNQQNRGTAPSSPEKARRAWVTLVWSTRDDHSYSLTGRTNRSVAYGSSSARGGRSIWPPERNTPKVDQPAPASQGSLTATLSDPGQLRSNAE